MIIFPIFLVVLVLLAVIDLVVGVSNDAVNFLNSAIGSKVATLRTILIIASLGILIGSLFSEGLMSIARNGIFQPEFFTFDRVFVIFLAVMFTDVILLDFYNTYGLPTSTTVSLIFELLGASFFVGIWYLLELQKPLTALGEVLNYKSAIAIVSGIFLSVFISFFTGALIHFFIRMLFTFRLKKTFKKFGSVFSGFSIAIIIYFLIIKGLEGTTLVTKGQMMWILRNTYFLMIILILFWTATMEILLRFSKINPLKIIVLFGTFSLAMAFAGNDLVNFIGVAAAGIASFTSWSGSGKLANEFNMGVLNNPVGTSFWILLPAGVIMLVTLWTNAKSRKVTETEVSLGRQEEGDEKFTSNLLSRMVVGTAVFFGKQISALIPKSIGKKIDSRFTKLKSSKVTNPEASSFDLLRASVNLMVATALIAYGTSQKLPLSTTFVTFMVAMGTSFADRAWGLESAVYRVAGVLQVIGGWFLTAIIAFIGSGIVATFLYFTSWYGVAILITVTAITLIRSHLAFRRQRRKEISSVDQFLMKDYLSTKELLNDSKINTAKNLKALRKVLTLCFEALHHKKENKIELGKKELRDFVSEGKKLNSKVIKYIRKSDKDNVHVNKFYLMVLDLMQDLYQSALLISDVVTEHRHNFHPLPRKRYLEMIGQMENQLVNYLDSIEKEINGLNFSGLDEVSSQRKNLVAFIEDSLDEEIKSIQDDDLSTRLAVLQTRILLETRDVVNTYYELHRLYMESVPSPSLV